MSARESEMSKKIGCNGRAHGVCDPCISQHSLPHTPTLSPCPWITVCPAHKNKRGGQNESIGLSSTGSTRSYNKQTTTPVFLSLCVSRCDSPCFSLCVFLSVSLCSLCVFLSVSQTLQDILSSQQSKFCRAKCSRHVVLICTFPR